MIEQPPGSPLKGKYLVRNAALNRLLRVTDWLLSRRLLSRAAPPEIPRPRRILLANGAHLGDVLLSLSVLPALRYAFPQARLGFLSGTWARCLLDQHPLVDWIHLVDHWKLNRSPLPLWERLRRYHDTRRRALHEIRRKSYDIAIDLYSYFPNSIPLLWQAGIRCRLGYTSGGFGPLLTHGLDWIPRNQHVTEYHADLLRCMGLSDHDLRYRDPLLPVQNAYLPQAVGADMHRLGIAPQGFVVFHTGTAAPLKEWPLPRWRQLAQAMTAEGHALVFTGTAGREQRHGEQIGAGLPRCLNLCGRLTWQGFVTTVRRARLLVGVDSVAGHVAAAVGTPCVVVSSGITSPTQWGPRGAACKMVSHAVPCAPCYRSRGCAGMECVRLVAVEEVQEAIQELLRLGHRQGA